MAVAVQRASFGIRACFPLSSQGTKERKRLDHAIRQLRGSFAREYDAVNGTFIEYLVPVWNRSLAYVVERLRSFGDSVQVYPPGTGRVGLQGTGEGKVKPIRRAHIDEKTLTRQSMLRAIFGNWGALPPVPVTDLLAEMCADKGLALPDDWMDCSDYWLTTLERWANLQDRMYVALQQLPPDEATAAYGRWQQWVNTHSEYDLPTVHVSAVKTGKVSATQYISLKATQEDCPSKPRPLQNTIAEQVERTLYTVKAPTYVNRSLFPIWTNDYTGDERSLEAFAREMGDI